MKIYTGKTERFEERNVYVNGQPLAPRLDLREHSPTEFGWGYGDAAIQLALAILADHAGDQVALQWYLDFHWDVIRLIDEKHWTLNSQQIDRWLAGKGIAGVCEGTPSRDLTYQEERELRTFVTDAFRDLSDDQLQLLDRAWLQMGGVEFAMHLHLCAANVQNERRHRIQNCLISNCSFEDCTTGAIERRE